MIIFKKISQCGHLVFLRRRLGFTEFRLGNNRKRLISEAINSLQGLRRGYSLFFRFVSIAFPVPRPFSHAL